MEELQFHARIPTFHSCTLTVGSRVYSSGFVTDRPLLAEELELAVPVIRAAFSAVQCADPRELHEEVATLLPDHADDGLFAQCELVSVSVSWNHQTGRAIVSLAYGFDDGVYAVASVSEGTITSVDLND
ncbi:hypothetical protein P9209_17020 [Prescottella defluvii]|nr:hypothetical protein P9209_17020 [Prescottella defluvii]